MALAGQKRGLRTRNGLITRLRTKKEKSSTAIFYCAANCTVNLPSLLGVAPLDFIWF